MAGLGGARRGAAGQGKARQGFLNKVYELGRGMARRGSAGQGAARQGKAGQGKGF